MSVVYAGLLIFYIMSLTHVCSFCRTPRGPATRDSETFPVENEKH